MAVEPGTRFGNYEIRESIGAGGMGEVYRATDTTLERDVAIKVLPASFADDAERVTRFEREAKLLATLNHANIAVVYGLDEHDGVHSQLSRKVLVPPRSGHCHSRRAWSRVSPKSSLWSRSARRSRPTGSGLPTIRYRGAGPH